MCSYHIPIITFDNTSVCLGLVLRELRMDGPDSNIYIASILT